MRISDWSSDVCSSDLAFAFVVCAPKACTLAGRPRQACSRLRRRGGIVSGEAANTLESYRESIDNIDAALVFMLAERFKITQTVGRYKASHGLPPADGAREKAQVERLRSLAKSANQIGRAHV